MAPVILSCRSEAMRPGRGGVCLLLLPWLLWLVAGSSVGVSSVAYAADAIPGEQWCDRAVDRIEFSGNRVTRDPVMRRELLQQEAQPCSLDDIIDGIQNIMDLGLFKSVRAEMRVDDAGLTLRYIVTEKIFFLPIPRFSRTSDGELRLGAQLRWDNFLGRLHQLKITSEKRQEDDGRGRTGYVHSVDYVVPRFFGSPYGMSVKAASERRNAQLSQDSVVFGEALMVSHRAGFQLSRWASGTRGVSGMSYFAGASVQQREYDLQSGKTGPFLEGQDFALIAGVSLQKVHQDSYRRRGYYYGGSVSIANTALGSDFSYSRVDMEARWYLPLMRPQTNLNIQLRLGLSDAAPFGELSYEIGGGELVRGMKSGRHAGNILTLLNVEYLQGLFAYPAWRWLVFTDVGNVYVSDDVNLLKQHYRAGAGLRWKLEKLTNADLRLDLAWDPQEGRVKPYVSTSLTF